MKLTARTSIRESRHTLTSLRYFLHSAAEYYLHVVEETVHQRPEGLYQRRDNQVRCHSPEHRHRSLCSHLHLFWHQLIEVNHARLVDLRAECRLKLTSSGPRLKSHSSLPRRPSIWASQRSRDYRVQPVGKLNTAYRTSRVRKFSFLKGNRRKLQISQRWLVVSKYQTFVISSMLTSSCCWIQKTLTSHQRYALLLKSTTSWIRERQDPKLASARPKRWGSSKIHRCQTRKSALRSYWWMSTTV